MTGTKLDAGKERFDLLPWHEFDAIGIDHGVESVAAALRMWWVGRPYRADFSIPQRQIRGIAAVLGYGAAKYAPRGWEAGIPFSRVFAAAQRHAASYTQGDHIDAESGLPHESLFWCNVLFLVVFTARGRTDLDDRPEPVASVRTQLEAVERMAEALTGMVRPAEPTPGESN